MADGLSATVGERRRRKGEKVGIYTEIHSNAHSHTSHTFRRGRRTADMKSCHLEKRMGVGGEKGKRRGHAKNICSTLLSIMCILRERAGRMPWSLEEAESKPSAFLIPLTHTVPKLYPSPKMRFYYSVELYTAAQKRSFTECLAEL